MNTSNNIPPYLNLSLEDMEGEIWKDVVGYEGLYQVSNLGRIKSCSRIGQGLYTKSVRIMKQKISYPKASYGQLMVQLSCKSNRFNALVHRLVAQAFIPNPDNKPCIDHIDANSLNNRVSNLRWVTHTENMNNPITKIRSKQAHNHLRNNKEWIELHRTLQPHAKGVCQMDLDGNVIDTYTSVMDASRKTAVKDVSIRHCCNGRTRTAYGYKWKFI